MRVILPDHSLKDGRDSLPHNIPIKGLFLEGQIDHFDSQDEHAKEGVGKRLEIFSEG